MKDINIDQMNKYRQEFKEMFGDDAEIKIVITPMAEGSINYVTIDGTCKADNGDVITVYNAVTFDDLVSSIKGRMESGE